MSSHDCNMILMIKNNFTVEVRPYLSDEKYQELLQYLEIVMPDKENEYK